MWVLDSKFRGTSLILLPSVKLCRKKRNAGAICIFQEFQNLALTHALEIEMSALAHFVSKSPQNAHCPAESHAPGFFVRNGTIHSFGFHNGSVGVDVLLSVGERS